MRIAYEVACNVIVRNMKVQKRYHDRSAHLNAYKVGDAVLKKALPPKEKGTKKFAARWEGPYFVIVKLDDVTYRVGQQDEKSWVGSDTSRPTQEVPLRARWTQDETPTANLD